MSPSKLLIGLSLLTLPAACGYGDRHYDDYNDYQDPNVTECSSEPLQGDIDVDEALDSPPGDGVGVFVEYATDGWWHVFTTCDTNRSNQACYFDVVLRSRHSSGIKSVVRENMESDDEISYLDNYVQVLAITDADLDGFYVQTEPGATLSVDVLLDGVCAGEYIYWVDGGDISHGGASTKVDLKPTAP